MKYLFDDLSARVSMTTTKMYSTSFSLGILFLHNRFRQPIYNIYGFVRFADEIVDSFEGYDQKFLLEKFRQDTYEAIEMGISLNPVLHSFQKTVREYNIDRQLIVSFLTSMEMDLDKQVYTRNNYEQYILGSAEVVGLMCLKVFAEGNEDLYRSLEKYAMKLGSAFQKVNFLRDLQYDYQVLGRTYFPEVNMEHFDYQTKKLIEEEIECDFETALRGIKKLPRSCRGGVYLAYVYYRSLLRKIQNTAPNKVFSERIRINNAHKFRLMVNCFFESRLNLL